MAVSATKYVGGAALVHPAFIEVSDADKVVAPLCLIDTKDEDKKTMDELFAAVEKKPFGEKCFRHRYNEQFHGFCAGRANFGDEENGKQAREVLSLFNRGNVNCRPTLILPTSSNQSCKVWNVGDCFGKYMLA